MTKEQATLLADLADGVRRLLDQQQSGQYWNREVMAKLHAGAAAVRRQAQEKP